MWIKKREIRRADTKRASLHSVVACDWDAMMHCLESNRVKKVIFYVVVAGFKRRLSFNVLQFDWSIINSLIARDLALNNNTRIFIHEHTQPTLVSHSFLAPKLSRVPSTFFVNAPDLDLPLTSVSAASLMLLVSLKSLLRTATASNRDWMPIFH